MVVWFSVSAKSIFSKLNSVKSISKTNSNFMITWNDSDKDRTFGDEVVSDKLIRNENVSTNAAAVTS